MTFDLIGFDIAKLCSRFSSGSFGLGIYFFSSGLGSSAVLTCVYFGFYGSYGLDCWGVLGFSETIGAALSMT